MEIQQLFLDVNPYSRPGTKLGKVKAVACHYIGNAGSTAVNNRNYFNNLQHTKKTYASSHYIIGLAGEIIQCIPENEISYCTNAANSYTISIEACHPDSTGKFNEATYKSYVKLCADICGRYYLDPVAGGLIRHYDVTGKVCPKWFVENTVSWEQFKRDVAAAMKETGWIKDSTGYYYLFEDGSYAIGWKKIDGVWYYFYDNGYMVSSSWIEDRGNWYYLNEDGSLYYGWLQYKGKWCYLAKEGSPEGAMVIGFQKLSYQGQWADYYFDEEGYMVTGEFKVSPDQQGGLRVELGSR